MTNRNCRNIVSLIIFAVLALAACTKRWRISDNNAHLKSFLDENMEMRDKLRKYER